MLHIFKSIPVKKKIKSLNCPNISPGNLCRAQQNKRQYCDCWDKCLLFTVRSSWFYSGFCGIFLFVLWGFVLFFLFGWFWFFKHLPIRTLPEANCTVSYDLPCNLCPFIPIYSCTSNLSSQMKYFFFLVLNPPLIWAWRRPNFPLPPSFGGLMQHCNHPALPYRIGIFLPPPTFMEPFQKVSSVSHSTLCNSKRPCSCLALTNPSCN